MISLVTVIEQDLDLEGFIRGFLGIINSYGSREEFELILVLNNVTSQPLDKPISSASTRVKVIPLQEVLPSSRAYHTGLRSAEGEIIVSFHFLLENLGELLPDIIRRMNKACDVVYCQTAVQKAGAQTGMVARFQRIAFFLIRKMTGIDLSPTGCVLKAFRGSLLQQALRRSEFYQFVPFLKIGYGARIESLSISGHLAASSETKQDSFWDSAMKLFDFTFFWFFQLIIQRPMRFFGTLFLFAILLASTSFLMALYLQWVSQGSITESALFFFSIFFTVASFQLLASGLLGELLRYFYWQGKGIRPYTVRSTRNLRNEEL